ncbi:hypothetical protein Q3O98_17280 [Ralstonia pseudosolanacearum]|nr:hypothetical protein [Ralstonia pseudosolanacearum]MDO3622835.1 hypothetical protein [Ralstonia pseudosolanacearum]
MLSPHEFAVLLLVNDSAESSELDRADVEVLIERKLVTLECYEPDRCYAQVTPQGTEFLKACGHVRASGRKTPACVH